MRQLKMTYIVLSGMILILLIGLLDIALRHNRLYSHTPLPANILYLLALAFLLLCLSAGLILTQLNKRWKAEARLIESESLFSVLVQKEKNHAIFLLDPTGKVMTWNEGARRIKGFEPQEIIGHHISIFYTQEDVDAREPDKNLEKAAQEGEYERFGWRKRKDGHLFWADVTITAIKNIKGELTGFIKITRDISAQRLAEEESKRALIREKELNEMKSRFVSLASHEFKTPLSVILSSVGLIERYDSPDMRDNRHRHIQRIRSNVHSLKQILNDFLSLERLESGTINNAPVPTDIVHLAAEAVSDFETSCKDGQRIRIEVRGIQREIFVDPLLLRHVLNNLLSNAIKYSPNDTEVSCVIEFTANTTRFIIADHGIGIPQEEQRHLFERFFRANNTAGISGTGLGLSIVKKYLDLMKGDISVFSNAGEGTTFTVTIA